LIQKNLLDIYVWASMRLVCCFSWPMNFSRCSLGDFGFGRGYGPDRNTETGRTITSRKQG
jgi:hypothetical protein